MKFLNIKRVVQLSDGKKFLVNCRFHLPSIIEAGIAPDDIIEDAIWKSIAISTEYDDVMIVAITDP